MTRLLVPIVALLSLAMAQDATMHGKMAESSPFLKFFDSVLTVYVREEFLVDKDVLEYASEIEETLKKAEIEFNKVTLHD